MGETEKLTEEVSRFCVEFVTVSSLVLPWGEVGETYTTLSFNSSVNLPLSLLNCKAKWIWPWSIFIFKFLDMIL